MEQESADLPGPVPRELRFPLSAELILRKRHALKKQLLEQTNLLPVRIAILGGSSTQEIKSILELFLLAHGIQPVLYESEYDRYYEEVVFHDSELFEFKPDIVFVHITWHNVLQFPEILDDKARVDALAQHQLQRFVGFWETIHRDLKAVIIQNNFDFPRVRMLGNLEFSHVYGRMNYLHRLNAEFAAYAETHLYLIINDILYLSARVGLDQWFDHNYWYSYRMALSPAATVQIAQNVANITNAIYGKTKKCLVLDLDNTLWGGVIGEDGLRNLKLGQGDPLGEAYSNFQRYLKDLQKRGVLLAACSKNNPETAKQGFLHPDSILKLDDFSVFKANWNPKPMNIRAIASELNLGVESLVFVDDDPVERASVATQVPGVAVPNVGSDVCFFPEILEREGFFEPVRITADDRQRHQWYVLNAQRSGFESDFKTHEEFLASLQMTAEIGPFTPLYQERITQLINKTNQFNLTTRRYTSREVEEITGHPDFISFYGRLSDKFGDNGLVSVIIGRIRKDVLEVDTWLMSCRVIKRGMEYAMWDALVEACVERGIRTIIGVYIPTTKNNMVVDFYPELGFDRISPVGAEQILWQYKIPGSFVPTSRTIRRTMVRVRSA